MALAAGDEIWRFQIEISPGSQLTVGASASAADGSFFLGGFTSSDWGGWSADEFGVTAAKLHSNGTLAWVWQEGSSKFESVRATAAMKDGGVILVGGIHGTHGENSAGDKDIVAVKLDSEGVFQWRWQEEPEKEESIYGAQATTDGNVVLTGYTAGQWKATQVGVVNGLVVKLDSSTGTVLWRYSGGAASSTTHFCDSAVRKDGSIVIAGFTYGDFDGTDSFSGATADFIAMALDEDGQELWRWQEGTGAGGGKNNFQGVAALDDGSVIIAGFTEGNWSSDDILQGGKDFAVVKLTSLGKEDWRWQGGTKEDDEMTGAATGIDGSSVILGGYTWGDWQALNKGGMDAVALSIDGEGSMLWTYQEGTAGKDKFESVAVSLDGPVLLAGWSTGAWDDTTQADDYSNFMAGVLIETGLIEGALSPPSVVGESPKAARSLQELEPTALPVVVEAPSPAPTLLIASHTPLQEGLVSQAEPALPLPSPSPNNSPSGPSETLPPIFGGLIGGLVLVVLVFFIVFTKSRHNDQEVGSSPDDTAATEGGSENMTNNTAVVIKSVTSLPSYYEVTNTFSISDDVPPPPLQHLPPSYSTAFRLRSAVL